MKKQELICIVCPKGCHLTLEMVDGDYQVTGNLCKRGATYGVKELTNPTRVLTSTVKVVNSIHRRLPVVTKGEIPKDRLFEAMAILNQVVIEPPINVGDVIIEGILGSNVNLVASRSIE